MKHGTLLFFSLVMVTLMTVHCQAQNESSFGAFYAMPVGSFKSDDLNGGGFAKPGWGVVFDSRFTYKSIPANWSLYSHSTYQWNNMDNARLDAVFTEALGHRTVTSQSRYSPLLTTLGPSYTMSLGKMKLVINSGAGVMFNNTRAFSIKVYDDNNVELLKETVNFDNNPAFAYLVGFELKFDIKQDLIGGAFYMDYTGAKQTMNLSFNSIDQIESFQKIQYLNIGFKFVFPKKSAN